MRLFQQIREERGTITSYLCSLANRFVSGVFALREANGSDTRPMGHWARDVAATSRWSLILNFWCSLAMNSRAANASFRTSASRDAASGSDGVSLR